MAAIGDAASGERVVDVPGLARDWGWSWYLEQIDPFSR
jgi:hypothetical protein